MARNRPYETQSFEFDYPCFVACPDAWQKAEKAYIRLSILYRADTVGTLDLSKYIPREFSGYYYLIKSGVVVEYKPIEFKHQEIFFDRHIWLSENTIQSSISDLTTIDTDIDSIDELSRVVGFTGGFLLDILTNLNIPFLDLGFEAIQGLIDSIASDDLNYFPSPDRPDKLAFSIPEGLVSLSLEFGWIPYSPIMIAGGLAELPIESQIELIKPSELFGLGTISDVKTFEEIAADKGLITTSQCSKNSALGSLQDAQSLGFSPSEILDKLLENGDILQDDIDNILANNPDFSPLDILEELVIEGRITGDDINRGLSDLSRESVPVQRYIQIFFADGSSVALRGDNYSFSVEPYPTLQIYLYRFAASYRLVSSPSIIRTTTYTAVRLPEFPGEPTARLKSSSPTNPDDTIWVFVWTKIAAAQMNYLISLGEPIFGAATTYLYDSPSYIFGERLIRVGSSSTARIQNIENIEIVSKNFSSSYDLGISGYLITSNEGQTYYSASEPISSIIL